MQSLKLSLQLFLFKLWNIRKFIKFKRFEKKLEKAVADQEVDRMILKFKIKKHMRKYLKVDARSKYIPRDIKNDEAIRKEVMGQFGTEMLRLGMTINHKLELCTP